PAGDVGVALAVQRDREGVVAVHAAVPAQVGRVEDAGPGRVQLGDEALDVAGGGGRDEGGLQGAGGRGEGVGLGFARDVGVAGRVHRDAVTAVVARAAQQGAVEDPRPRRVDLEGERLAAAGEGGLEGAGGRGEVAAEVGRVAGDVGVAGGV